MICGALSYSHPAARNLIAALPKMLVVDPLHSPQTEWMHSTLRLMAVESRERRPGGEAVITRLGDILVVQAIRSWIETDPAARTGWLGALHDRQIGGAITLIHHKPAQAWTIASLANEVAMSRSAFAARLPNSSVSRSCSTSHVGECMSRWTYSRNSIRAWLRWPTVWVIDPKPLSAAPSNALLPFRPERSDEMELQQRMRNAVNDR
jgi:hypothetical protein